MIYLEVFYNSSRKFSMSFICFKICDNICFSLILLSITSILKKKDMTLLQIVKEMPTFVEAEEENSYMKEIFHGPDSKEIHMRLSMSICAKLQPIVQKLLEESKIRGEIHIQDTATAASFCVYGQLGILLNQEITREERVERIKSFLITILKAL